MGEVINLADIKNMQKALDEANIPHGPEDPRVLVYRDVHGIPQIIVEGEGISQQQYNNLPDEILDIIVTEESNGRE